LDPPDTAKPGTASRASPVIILSAPDAFPSGGLPIIVVQHAAQPLAAPDRSTIASMRFIRDDQPVAQTLVVSLGMIMRDEFVNPFAQRALAEEDHALQADRRSLSASGFFEAFTFGMLGQLQNSLLNEFSPDLQKLGRNIRKKMLRKRSHRALEE
jgi:hypothetical protein